MFEKSLLTYAMTGKVLVGLLIVFILLALFAGALKFLRTRNFTTHSKKELKILQTHPLSNKAHLTVVAWQDTHYLLACSADAVTVIDTKVSSDFSAASTAPLSESQGL